MASRKGESAGSAGSAKGVGKVGKLKVEDRQSRLATVEKEGGKRVTFRLEERKEEVEEQEAGLAEIIRHEVRREVKDGLKAREDKIRKELEEIRMSIKKKEERWEGIRDMERGWERKWEEKWKEIREGLTRLEKEMYERINKRIEEIGRVKLGEEEEGRSRESVMEKYSSESEKGISLSKGSRYGGSSGTLWSEDRLSNREVDKIRKWVNEQERLERRENIVMRGVVIPAEMEKERGRGREWVRDWIKNKLGVECTVSEVRRSGPVIVVKIKGEKGKKK